MHYSMRFSNCQGRIDKNLVKIQLFCTKIPRRKIRGGFFTIWFELFRCFVELLEHLYNSKGIKLAIRDQVLLDLRAFFVGYFLCL